MTAILVQQGLYAAALLAGTVVLGRYLANAYAEPNGQPEFEAPLYRLAGIDPAEEMSWPRYAAALVWFNVCGFVFLGLLLLCQGFLPGNPQGFGGVRPDLAFNIAVSFVTNTNWQAYGGETTLSQLTQTVGLGSQNFLSAATGLAALEAVLRGFVRHDSATLGNAWRDLTRSVTRVLLPLSLVLAVVLAGEGVVQSFAGPMVVTPLDPAGAPQTIVVGPVASQLAIKQLGTNGGGYFNANSAHPFENPTPLSNFLEMLAILLLPAACCFRLGIAVDDGRQGRALFAAMAVLLVGGVVLLDWAELQPAPAAVAAGAYPTHNLEGKEVRVGIGDSALWGAATTAASNGSVNAMHDSFSPLGGLVPLVLMLLGEVVFGGVGSGLYGLLIFAVLTVFLCGLMIGRTPEYLGKRIEAPEMRCAAAAILLPGGALLLGTAVAVLLPSALANRGNPGPHGFSEMLYAFASAANNNGSAFAGLTVDTPFWNLSLGLAMLIGRYGVLIPVLALAGGLAAKKKVPTTAGTFPTHGLLFVFLLTGTVLIVGGLTFLPALALGPIVEHLRLTELGLTAAGAAS